MLGCALSTSQSPRSRTSRSSLGCWTATEIPEPGAASLTARPELEAAQKESYAEARTQWFSQKSGGKKGDSKGKNKGGKFDRGENAKGDKQGKKSEGKGNDKK